MSDSPRSMRSSDSLIDSLQSIEDVSLTLRAEIDRRIITFRELLELGAESLVVLSRPSGENVDLYAGEVHIGTGEVVVIEGALAVRLADLGDCPGVASPVEIEAERTPEAA